MIGDKDLSNADKQRLLQVLGDLCNGQLNALDEPWLQDLLTENASARAVYIDYLELDASLTAEGITLADQDMTSADASITTAAHDLANFSSSSAVSTGRSGIASFWRKLPSWAVAATLFGIALFSSATTLGLISLLKSTDSQVAVASAQVVARITGTQNSLWRHEETHPIGYGSELVAGQELELIEGLAEITFNDGATVLLESPARFLVKAPHEVRLEEGRMAAVVPAQSHGFRVHTRNLDIFDAGTEFGLMARQSGAAELHVFNGAVRADILDSTGKALRRLELNASEAARVNPVSTTVAEFPADKAAFVCSLEPTTGPRDGLLAYEGFDYPAGPLDAQNGGYGWAGPWFGIAADSKAGPDSNGVAVGSLTSKGIVPMGNRAVQTAQQNRIRRTLATSIGSVFDAAGLVEDQDSVRLVGRDGKRVYISFIQRVSKVSDSSAEFYGLELHRADGNVNRVLSIGNGAEDTLYGATSNYNVYGAGNFPTLGVEDTEANLYVVKITFGVENHDVVEVYRNPESLRDEQASIVDAELHGNFAFDRIGIASFHGSKIHEIDEIHVGTHYLAVTGRWGGKRGLQRQGMVQLQQEHRQPGVLTRWTGQNYGRMGLATLFSGY
ncbi:FecR domain-containing protein [Bythopirellula polymerisocia]|uniref:FecR protein n=1 Tax=Bythopirellula polymerisocia TaxID=2528003 RepID=A0A5C6CXK7_9BACT|nr:FecR domain-containing protein [Bythopirellula polymerisocia]TWU27766.1 FecR protein [Bythopirellula polymerisocia]